MVSAIVLSYNRSNDLIYTVEKLKELQSNSCIEMEIIVVDNASTDCSSIMIERNYPDIKLVKLQSNVGIAGWNEGFKIASHKYLLVLDDDSHLESGLEDAVYFLEAHNDIGILALNITSGAYATRSWKNLSETIGFIGCGAIIKREVYYKIGGFAEWIGINSHEWDYGIRCIDSGYKIVYFQESSVVHRANEDKVLRKSARVSATRNEMAIVYKHFTNNRWMNILRVCLNNMALVKKIGPEAIYYSFLGLLGFLKIIHKLKYTPVSTPTQAFFEHRFWGTQPLFDSHNKEVDHDLS